VIWTDAFQAAVMVIGLLAIVIRVSKKKTTLSMQC